MDEETTQTTAGASGISADERQWGMIAHLSALAGLIVPFGHLLGPLIIWMVKKDTMPFVDDQGKEALNFQITLSIALFVCFLLIFVAIGIVLMPLVGLAGLILAVIAGIKANEGVAYRYPFTLRLIK
ncbi:DUF4870 domain-containing protein [Solilutibacter silvestris]|uniref:DUF4870 domain-containing protein n=1 Tax=Solilutibacter silvestris TaxID=1645665 RepID=UPI003D32F529